jgi:hypothetical protein
MEVKMIPRDHRADERGFALVATLLVVVAVLALGAIGLQSSSIGLKISANHLHENQALGLAEGGIEHALALIVADADGFNDELSSSGTGGALSALGSVVSVQGRSYRFHQTSASGDGYYIRAEDNYDEKVGADDPTVDTDQSIKIVARGRTGGAERVVEVVIGGSPLFPYTVWTELYIKISGSGLVDSYDSRNGPYVFPANSVGDLYTNGFINLSSSTTVWGDASAVGTVTTSGSAQVKGVTTESATPLSFDVVAPCGPPYSSGIGISGVGSWSYTAATGKLSGSGGASITLANGTYCMADVVLSGGSLLNVNGPVQLWMTGKFDSSGGGVTNNTAIASNFLLFVNGGNDVKVSGGGGAYMAIHARDSKVVFSGGSNFWGAVIAKSLDNTGGTSFHFDEALGGLLTGGGMQRILWREVKNR